jgi:tuftelin-interacting protein 11
VILWRKVLSSNQISFILAGEFFPKWLNTLYQWLSTSNPDLEEVAEWYVGWKSFLSSDLLGYDPFLLRNFNLALDMMNDYLLLDASSFLQKYIHILSQKNKTTFYTLMRLNNIHNKLQEKQILMNQHKANTSLKELLEVFAEKHGVEFKPKFNKSVEGKTLWEFGKDLCYLDNNVIFFQEREDKNGNGTYWKPISIQDLVARAQISKIN